VIHWAVEQAGRFILTATIVAAVLVIANDARWRYLRWRFNRRREK
jgi:hypothetical protein